MATYLFVHRQPLSYVGSPEAAAEWAGWFEQLGAALEDRGNAVFERQPVGNCGPEFVLGGYTLVTANDLDTAMALAGGCPMVTAGGGVEVGLLVPVPGREHPARVF